MWQRLSEVIAMSYVKYLPKPLPVEVAIEYKDFIAKSCGGVWKPPSARL